jgi:thioredoxin reductase
MHCASCHPIHRSDQGVAFVPGEPAIRFAPGVEVELVALGVASRAPATVAIASAGSCAACHDVTSPRDPVARCLVPGQEALGKQRPIVCFDEHQAAIAPDLVAKREAGVCAAQHTEDRAVVWEAARDAAIAMPVLAPLTASLHPWFWIGAGLVTGAFAFAGVRGAHAWSAARRRRAPALVPEGLVKPAVRVRLPRIDVTTCLGCYACVDACPYDVLDVERYVAVLARPEACCGLTLCEQRCPNGSLKITDGAAIGDRPCLDDSLQSPDIKGLYLAGDITGLPLIKNAILQGAHAVTHMQTDLRRAGAPQPGDPPLDLLIIGAGPAGISAALRAKELDLRFEVIEQGSVAQSIRSFPRGKLVFDQPLELPVTGKLWLKESSKEELLSHWMRVVRQEKLPIRQDTRMTAIVRSPGGFTVTTEPREGGPCTLHRARRVLLAIGQRGTPRRLPFELSADMESSVHYHLADAKSFAGRKVLIAGLGDVAMETAIALARQPGTTVTVAYRGSGFSRGKSRNIEEVRRMSDAGRLSLRFQAEISAIEPGRAVLKTPSGPLHLPCDAVFVMIGNIAPLSILRAAGVRTIAEQPPAVPATAASVPADL